MDKKPPFISGTYTGSPLEEQISALEYAQKINYTLFKISNAVNLTHNIEQLYASIYDALNELMPLPNFFIAIYDEKNKTINFDYFIDEFDDDMPIVENLEEPNCLTGEVILARRPLFFKENMLIARAQKNKLIGTIPKTWIGIPLTVQDKVIGAIAVQHYSDPDYFSHHHLEVLVSVSEQIAIAIERKQILDALEKKEKTLSLITDNTSSVVAIFDSHGKFEFANPVHEKMGFRPDRLPGTSFFDLIHPEDSRRLLKLLKKGLSDKSSHISLEFRVKNQSGHYLPMKGTFDIIKNRDGFMEKIVFIGEDTSSHEKAQKALDESEKRFRLIFETSPDAIIITDLESGIIFDVNNAFVELAGLEKDRIVGRTTTGIGIWKDKAQRSDFVSKVKQKGSYENLEATLVLDGKAISTLVSSRTLILEGRLHLLSIIRDISERKNLEEQLLQRQKMDSIGTLASGIAHDFNNLLSGITGYLELLDSDNDNLTENQKQNIFSALKSSHRAAKLTRQLQTLTRTNVSKPSAVDLFTTVQDVFDILEQTTDPLIEKRNELIENRCFVNGYENELHQVLMNLGMNAVQAIEEKNETSGNFIRVFTPKSSDSRFKPASFPQSDYVHLCFEDTGCGMTHKIKSQAFDPMFSTKKMGDRKGQGLGLAMVYYIITKKHNGYIDIDSKPGEGTRFHIYLPLAKVPADHESHEPPPKGGAETILVIDDEDMVRDMAVKALDSFGYKTFEAADGKAGLEIYKQNQDTISAVLLDIIMPKMSGVETFKRLLNINPDVKVVIASGHITNKEQKKLFAKACAYLDKPYQIIQLKKILRSILDQ